MTAFLGHYANKQLNQIVFPGSHDAGIYGQGKDNVITQSLDIAGQANAGVRFFDLRIATVKRSDGSFDQKSYHLARASSTTSTRAPSPARCSRTRTWATSADGGRTP